MGLISIIRCIEKYMLWRVHYEWTGEVWVKTRIVIWTEKGVRKFGI
jgi:hypothetical protein